MHVLGEAGDGAEAMTLAENQRPNVVVMDMRMPNVDGIEATEKIASAEWAMPVVVLSAYDEPQMIEAALAAGASNCLKKGVGPRRADRRYPIRAHGSLSRTMRLCLMVEGQEDVSWDRVAGAGRGDRTHRPGRTVSVGSLPLG